jgi:hypothetical protein
MFVQELRENRIENTVGNRASSLRGFEMEFVIAIEVLVGLVFIVMFGSNVLELDLSRRSYRCLSNPFEDAER